MPPLKSNSLDTPLEDQIPHRLHLLIAMALASATLDIKGITLDDLTEELPETLSIPIDKQILSWKNVLPNEEIDESDLSELLKRYNLLALKKGTILDYIIAHYDEEVSEKEEVAHVLLMEQLTRWVEWLYEMDSQIEWLQSIEGIERRTQEVESQFQESLLSFFPRLYHYVKARAGLDDLDDLINHVFYGTESSLSSVSKHTNDDEFFDLLYFPEKEEKDKEE